MGLPILPLFLILCIGYRTGVVVSPKLHLIFYHTVTCTRRRTGGCGKSIRISLLLRSLRSTVTGLISAPRKSRSGHRKTYMIPRYCLFHVPNTSMIFDRHGVGVPAGRLRLKTLCVCARTRHKRAPPAPASHAGAFHGNRQSGHCIGSLNTSAETGNVGEGLRIAHVFTHRCSSAENCGIEGRIGRTPVWR